VPYLETFGAAATFCTTVSSIPELRNCLENLEAGDLSLKMLLLLATGLAFGFTRGDAVIITSDALGLALLGGILIFKIRGSPPSREKKKSAGRIRPVRSS
jgi:MtN3 and saliva related transmembrane protein